METEESIIVDFDVAYFVGMLGIAPGWYFWFVDQYNRKAGPVIGPFTLEDVYRAGKLAVRCYYDE